MRASVHPRVVGEEHYDVARTVQETLQGYRDLQDIIAILGMEELSEEDMVQLDVEVYQIMINMLKK